ncbi:hypothetical protein KKF84_11945 [Myxococcota bacterium]|nr:hypothetical protein [Myxococcota bacterium]MBU1536025.1 hypothetical protein [Myxococcota bacterium]
MKTYLHLLVAVAFLFTLLACEGETGYYGPDAGEDVDQPDVTEDVDSAHDTGPDADADVIELPVCGNHRIEEGEVCDDGNTVTGDGCNASCSLLDGFDFVGNGRTFGDQDSPVLVASDSTVVLIYTDWSASDGGGAGIKAHFFQADGKSLFEINVNNVVTGGNQYAPAAVVNADGNILIVWINEITGGSFHEGIRGRVIDMNGTEVAPEFQIDEFDDGPNVHPTVATSDGGTFFVLWADPAGVGGADLKGRFFNAQGIAQMNGVTTSPGEFTLPVESAGLQIRPRATFVAPGRWVVVYEDYSLQYDTQAPGITAQLMELNGTAVASFGLNGIITEKQAEPVFVATQTQYTACWIDNSHQFDPWVWGIHCRLFGLDFLPLADEFLVSENITASQIKPALQVTDDGYLVLWEDWSAIDGNGASIRARRFNSAGEFTTGEFGINTTRYGHQTTPAVTRAGDLYWFAWTDGSQEPPDDQGTAVRLRLARPSTLSD